jgi:glycosyltransferase involved in cell wall biosynthesis
LRICVFVSNDMINDPRVSRHARTLGQMGHRVLVVCRKSERTSLTEEREFYSIRRITIPYYEYYKIRTGIRGRKMPYDMKEASSTRPPKISPIRRTIRLLVGLIVFPLCLTWAFWRVGREFSAEIYVTNDLDTLLAGILCSATSRILIHDAHELWPDQWTGMNVYPGPAVAWLRLIESLLLKRPDVTITVNPLIAEVMQKRYNIHRPQVILNAPEVEASNAMKEERRIGPQKVALYQGLYALHRGLENLISACEFLENDVTLVLRGQGASEYKLREIAKRFNNCRLDSPVEMKELVRAASSTADVGVVSYVPINMNNYLASPNKLFEYIQAGLAVVGSDLPFLRQIIVDNNIGYVFNPHSPRDIARAINMATRDSVLCILRDNVQKIQKLYSWDEEKKKLIQLILKLTKTDSMVAGPTVASGELSGLAQTN